MMSKAQRSQRAVVSSEITEIPGKGDKRFPKHVTDDIKKVLREKAVYLFDQGRKLVEVIADEGRAVPVDLNRLMAVCESLLVITKESKGKKKKKGSPEDNREDPDSIPSENADDPWRSESKSEEEPVAETKKTTERPTHDDLKVVLNQCHEWAPPLSRVVRCPYVKPDGTVASTYGYDPVSSLYHDHETIDLPDVQSRPYTEEYANDLRQAAELICAILAPWKFSSKADRAHALSLLFLPFFRPALNEQTPLHIISASGSGEGKCLVGDTFVASPAGMIRIQDAKGLTQVHGTVDPVTLQASSSVPAQWMQMAPQATIRVRTHSGVVIEGTADHPLLVWNGAPTWIALKDLKEGDHLLLWPGYARECGTRFVDEEEAYLAGLFAGNGCRDWAQAVGLTGVKFSTSYPEIAEAYCSRAERFWGYLPHESKSSCGKVASDWKITSRSLAAEIQGRFPGLVCASARDKFVPPAIPASTKEERIRFLQGLFDTDAGVSGHEFEWSSASERLAREVHQLLLGLGVVSLLRSRKVKGQSENVTNHTYWRIIITGEHLRNFKELIGFRCSKYKQELLTEVCARVSNPNIGCYPHVGPLLKKLVPEWKALGRWEGADCTVDGKVAKNYYRGVTSPSRERLLFFLQGCTSEPAQLLRNLTQFYPDPVAEVSHSSALVPVYDWHVPQTHSFVANGIVSHNSALAELVGALMGDITCRGLSSWGSESQRLLAEAVVQQPDILFLDNLPPNALLSPTDTTDLLRYSTGLGKLATRAVGKNEWRGELKTIWILTSIDLHKHLCLEVARRSLIIQLGGSLGTPAWTGGLNISTWVKANRGVVQRFALLLVREAMLQTTQAPVIETTKVGETFSQWAKTTRKILEIVDLHSMTPDDNGVLRGTTRFMETFLTKEAVGADDKETVELCLRWPEDEVGQRRWLSATEVAQTATELGLEKWTANTDRSSVTKLGSRLSAFYSSKRSVSGYKMDCKMDPRGKSKVYRPIVVGDEPWSEESASPEIVPDSPLLL